MGALPPRVNVIIPAYNEAEVIQDCIESLIAQDYPNFSVEFIDDSSTDNTAEIIKKFSEHHPNKIHLHQYGKVGPGKARNITADRCEGDIFAFTDADCFAEPNWLSELIQGFESDNVASTGGPHVCPPQSNDFQRKLEKFLSKIGMLIDFYKRPISGIRNVPHNPLCNVAYRREIFKKFNGFREDLFPGEDVELDLRIRKAGYQITYNPNALVYHHRPENIRQWKKVMHAYGRAQGKLLRERGIERKIQLLGVLFLISLVFGPVGLYFLAGLKFYLLASALTLGVFFVRPPLNNFFGILMNSLQWFNGLIEGFITKRSDPPGFRSAEQTPKKQR